MKRYKLALLSIFVFMGLAIMPAPARAINVFGGCNGNDSQICAATTAETQAADVVKNIINLMLFGIGAVAVVLIIHSGLKYITSRGDPANIKSAKDTLLYAVIGLIVALMAFTIVNFVLERFGGGGTP